MNIEAWQKRITATRILLLKSKSKQQAIKEAYDKETDPVTESDIWDTYVNQVRETTRLSCKIVHCESAIEALT